MDIDQLANLRQAYEELERRVQRALNTQVGDNQRLTGTQNEVLSYSRAVERVCRINSIKGRNDSNPRYRISTSSRPRSSLVVGEMLH
jgi:hypothetical protein